MQGVLTPTQTRMARLLADGMPHSRGELFGCLDDDLAKLSAIQFHITRIRQALPRGESVECVLQNGKICYRHVRLLPNAYNGKR